MQQPQNGGGDFPEIYEFPWFHITLCVWFLIYIPQEAEVVISWFSQCWFSSVESILTKQCYSFSFTLNLQTTEKEKEKKKKGQLISAEGGHGKAG